MKSWQRYLNYYLHHYASSDVSSEAGLPFLRDKLFISILLITLPLGVLIYIPSVIVSFLTNQYVIGIIDTVAILVILFIFFSKNLRISIKKILYSSTLYMLAIVLLVYLGTQGPGIIILIFISVLTTLFHSRKAGLISIVLNALIFSVLFAAFTIKAINYTSFQFQLTEGWIVIGINFIAFNALIVLSVSFFVDQLNLSVLKEKNLQALLKKESLHLQDAKQKAEESDRLKSAFLANMSHEIRTPMNGILGFAELLKEPDLTGDQQQKYINIIEKSGARMLNIINDIIDISKIEAGLMKIDLKESNINEQIEYIYTFFKPEVEGKGMKLFFKNSLPKKDAFIITDREKLYAILTNLVKNAIKYTNVGFIEFGYDVVETLHATSLSQSTNLQFYVKDTGIGIPKARQKAIFERFIQVDIGDKRVYQGAGLGLAISKAYIEMLGGKIWVESDPEAPPDEIKPSGLAADRPEKAGGSTFYFTLPFNTKTEEIVLDDDIVIGEIVEYQINKLKILIAEDDEDSEKFLRIGIKMFDKEILIAKTGVEAVDICLNNPDIDLVLMDIQMPEMNGYEATRQIREFNTKVIIIAQTAYALTGDREKALEAGCNDYITKPIGINRLMLLLQKYFKKYENES